MYEKYNKKIYEIKPICPSICPPKPLKPHQIRKEYYPPKPRAEGSSPSAPAKDIAKAVSFSLVKKHIKTNPKARGACRGVRVSCGDLCEAEAPTEPAGVLPLPR